jgi:hypothetical protein
MIITCKVDLDSSGAAEKQQQQQRFSPGLFSPGDSSTLSQTTFSCWVVHMGKTVSTAAAEEEEAEHPPLRRKRLAAARPAGWPARKQQSRVIRKMMMTV